MRKAKALAGLQERLGSYEPALLAVDVPLCWRWRHGNQRQSDPAILTSSDLNTLYNAPTILEIMKDLGVVDFPELLGTSTVSHRLFWKWNDSHTILFSAKTDQSMQTHQHYINVQEGVQQTPCTTATVLASSKLSE